METPPELVTARVKHLFFGVGSSLRRRVLRSPFTVGSRHHTHRGRRLSAGRVHKLGRVTISVQKCQPSFRIRHFKLT